MTNKQRISQIDSIQELAEFWDTHDITEFEDQIEEMTEPVFVRADEATIRLPLPVQAWQTLRKLAEDRGTTDVALAQQWVLEKLKAA